MSRLAPLLAILLIAGACTPSAPPATQPETGIDVPDSFGTAETAATVQITETWWEDFQTDQLSAAIEQALAFNADLIAAAARVDQAAAQARIAGADLKPQVSAGLSGNRAKRNFVGFPIPGGEDEVLSTISNNYGVSVDLSWEIDLWGRLSAQARQGLAAFQASQADYQGRSSFNRRSDRQGVVCGGRSAVAARPGRAHGGEPHPVEGSGTRSLRAWHSAAA